MICKNKLNQNLLRRVSGQKLISPQIKTEELVKFKKLANEKIWLEFKGQEFPVPLRAMKSFDENFLYFENFSQYFYLYQIKEERKFLN